MSTSETQPTEVWLRDGSLLYWLEPSGQYRKGVEVLQNRYTVQVSVAPGRPSAEAEMLAEQILTDLNRGSSPRTGVQLLEASRKARQAFHHWHEATFTEGTRVQFKQSNRTREGVVVSQYINRDGELCLYVREKGGTQRLHAIEDEVVPIATTVAEELPE